MIPNYSELTPKEFFITYIKMSIPTATDLDGIGVGLWLIAAFGSADELKCEYYRLFMKNNKLIDASKLTVIPISEDGCAYMFSNCTSLEYPPKLPATKLTNGCYSFMFYSCTSLTTAPDLPATTLAEDCYRYMFTNCFSLTIAPELPATTLASSCYESMFHGCKSLTTAPALPATTLAQYCYEFMFNGCTSLTKAPDLPATTLANSCYKFMFQDCKKLVTAPELPATTLVGDCYSGMFYNCSSLNHIKMLATDISAGGLNQWVYNVANNGTFIKHPNMNSLPIGSSGIPNGWNIGIEIDYKKFSIINNSNNDEIIFNYNNGIYSLVKGKHIDLFKYTPLSFVPEIDLNIDIYKVSQDNIGILKLTDVVWGSGASLEELCYAYGINDLEGVLIIIKSINDNYNDGYYDYYNNDYYNSPKTGMHMYYSKDNGNTWIGDIYSSGESFAIDVNQGDVVMFKASRDENDINTSKNIGGYLTFNIKSNGNLKWIANANSGKFSNSTASFDVSGNIMSLVYGDNFEDKNQLNTIYIFS
jgi:hypothetical protein